VLRHFGDLEHHLAAWPTSGLLVKHAAGAVGIVRVQARWVHQ
jgi:hypothetical protein